MKIKTTELTGAALDWAVASIECDTGWLARHMHLLCTMPYSTDWAQGGYILEREGMTVALDAVGWEARHYDGESEPWVMTGDTPLTAAMRCYVASKLGDEVEVPNRLL